jgi:hypothetical protein
MRYTSTAFILGAGVVAVASCPSKAATQAEWQQCKYPKEIVMITD